MPSTLPGPVLQFGECVLDCGRFELRRNGNVLRVERKPMELLILLVSREGQLVTRAEIAGRLWSNEVFVDTEHGINTAIRKLRYCLRDDPEQPQYIQTVPGMGYRFVASVEEQPVAAAPTPHPEPEARSKREWFPPRWIWIAATLSLLALIGTVAVHWIKYRHRQTSVRFDSAAFDGYMQGRYLLNKRDMNDALPLFRRAVVLDPNSAKAWGGLAVGLAESAMASSDPLHGPVPEAKAAARHAIELDPNNGEAWSALGLVAMNWEWDWRTADQDFQRAIALSPDDSSAEWLYATWLSIVGRHDEAVMHMKRALELNPMAFISVRHMGSVLYWARHYDEAIQYLHRAAEMEPDRLFLVLNWESKADDMIGLHNEAVAADLQISSYGNQGTAEGQRWHAMLEDAWHSGGWKAYWETRLQILQSLPSTRCNSFDIAADSARIGRNDDAFHWLERGVTERCFATTTLATDPIFDGLRADPRYRNLLRELHLVQ